MNLNQILIADLQRQYFYELTPNRQAKLSGVFKRSLHPRFTPILLCRLAYYFHSIHLNPIAKIFSLINFVVFGIEVAVNCEIGEGLYFPHTVGTVIGARKIGRNALIYQGVTIGAKELDFTVNLSLRPLLGDDVVVGSGAKILGGIEISNGVSIGANAVVTKSLPANVVAVGIPARIIQENNVKNILIPVEHDE
jgi:serine O-acetyltransferase